ncbi:MAG: aminotransferase class I/II-fold pyridoxal phosphate-dependent enzyme [Acidimicrobiales bacterium]
MPAVTAAIAAAASGVNRYADHRATELRAALAGSMGVDPRSVTVGCGSVGLLQQLCLTYVEPGDDIVYPWRSFEVYPVYTQLVGARAVTVPLADEAFDLDAVAAAVTPATRVVFLATPNNPTGTAVSSADLRRFLEAVDRRSSSSSTRRTVSSTTPGWAIRWSTCCRTTATRSCCAPSPKAHGLAGLRVGYMVAAPEVVDAVDKTLFPFAVNALAQAAALAALGAQDEIRGRVATVLAERDRVAAALAAAGHRFPAPRANFVWLPLGARTDDLYLALERRGVVTRPFSREGLRVTIGTPEENDRFLATLAEVV